MASDFITNLIRTKYRGTWASDYPYEYKDSCTHNGTIYYCDVDNTNIEPPNASYWTLMVSKGDPGTQGEGLGTHESAYNHAQIHDGSAQDTIIAGKTTLVAVKADGDIADALTKKHANTLDHSNSLDHTQNTDTDLDATFEAALKNTDNHTSGSINKVFTGTEQTKLAGITAGAQINADITKAEIEAKLTGAISSHTHSGSGPVSVKVLAGDAAENETTAMVKITGLDQTVGAGTWVFEYYILAQSADVLNSMKFAVTHSGTTNIFIYNLYFPSAGVTAATGAVDQECNTTTGQVWAFEGTRVKNTTLGPTTGVDTANSNILYRISGICTVTVSGNLQLYHGSELAQANGTIVKANSCLILTQIA